MTIRDVEDAFFKVLKWIYGDGSITVGQFCAMCNDVHALKERCNRQLERWCLDCDGWRFVAKYFRCPSDPKHELHPSLRREEGWKPAEKRPKTQVHARLHVVKRHLNG